MKRFPFAFFALVGFAIPDGEQAPSDLTTQGTDMETSPIQWCDGTVNPVMGCSGCELWDRDDPAKKRCYAGVLHERRGRSNSGYSPQFETTKVFPGRMEKASRWRDLAGCEHPGKPWLNEARRMIFVSDMGDALSEGQTFGTGLEVLPERGVPFQFLKTEIIDVVTSERGQRHVWMWLTKRPRRMAKFATWLAAQGIAWPENLWVGTSITTRKTLHRIRELANVGNDQTTRFISVEPLFEEVSLANYFAELAGSWWVIIGGESKQSKLAEAHEFKLEWVRKLAAECKNANVPFFIKQLGRNPTCCGEHLRLKDAHGGDWSEWPIDLRVREIPHSAYAETGAGEAAEVSVDAPVEKEAIMTHSADDGGPKTTLSPPAASLAPDQLKPHPRNAQLYSEVLDDGFLEGIRQNGILEPIIVSTHSHRIVSGHRRWAAAMKLGLSAVPVGHIDCKDEYDELGTLLNFNMHRKKTEAEQAREFALRLEIERAKAKVRMVEGGRLGGRNKGSPTSATPSDAVADRSSGDDAPKAEFPKEAVVRAGKAVEWGASKAKKYAALLDKKPEFAARVSGGELSVNAAYRLAMAEKRQSSSGSCPTSGGSTTSTSGNAVRSSGPAPTTPSRPPSKPVPSTDHDDDGPLPLEPNTHCPPIEFVKLRHAVSDAHDLVSTGEPIRPEFVGTIAEELIALADGLVQSVGWVLETSDAGSRDDLPPQAMKTLELELDDLREQLWRIDVCTDYFFRSHPNDVRLNAYADATEVVRYKARSWLFLPPKSGGGRVDRKETGRTLRSHRGDQVSATSLVNVYLIKKMATEVLAQCPGDEHANAVLDMAFALDGNDEPWSLFEDYAIAEISVPSDQELRSDYSFLRHDERETVHNTLKQLRSALSA